MFASARSARPKFTDPVCTIVIDAEEDFNWLSPIYGTEYLTFSMRNVRDLYEILSTYHAVPAYLLTFPVLEDADVVGILRRQVEKGHCVAGVQLHPWVTPPFDEEVGHRSSFAGNLHPVLEEKKLVALKRKFAECFGFEPLIFKAGRYGLGQATTALLEKHGFTIDTSVAPRTTFESEGGPDYTGYDYGLFWFGERRNLLEVPLCRSAVGWGGRWASSLYQALSTPQLSRVHAPSLLARSRFAERITLSPEGNDTAAMIRLVRRLRARGLTVFVLSFHSSSLGIGQNPYVQSKADLHVFYDRLSGILDYMATSQKIKFASILEIPDLLTDSPAVRGVS